MEGGRERVMEGRRPWTREAMDTSHDIALGGEGGHLQRHEHSTRGWVFRVGISKGMSIAREGGHGHGQVQSARGERDINRKIDRYRDR